MLLVEGKAPSASATVAARADVCSASGVDRASVDSFFIFSNLLSHFRDVYFFLVHFPGLGDRHSHVQVV